MTIHAVYFDGKSARDNQVTVTLEGRDLVFGVAGFTSHRWNLSHMHPIDPPSPGNPFRLSHDEFPGERLIIKDEDFIKDLMKLAPALKGGYTVRHFSHVIGWTVAGITAFAILGFIVMSWLPQYVAPYLPEKWKNDTGKQIEQSVVAKARECTSAGGMASIGKMVGSLSNGNDLPPISVRVYDLPIVNAFAVSGGRIIMTRGLIDTAESPDEVAGVLAHEIGHVANFHPEEQLVRLAGLQVMLSVVGGSGNGDWVTNVAALAALFRYSRGAEEEADAYARETLLNAKVNPLGFKTFFEKMIRLEKKMRGNTDQSSVLSKLGDVFSTHPDTEERIKQIEPLPAGTKAVPSLSPAEWNALKGICRG